MARLWSPIAVAVAIAVSALARAEPPSVSAAPPPGLTDPAATRLWTEAVSLEAERRYPEAIARFEALRSAAPGSSMVHWRAARLYWRSADLLPAEDTEGRVTAFLHAREAAGEGLAVDPECAECMLWRVAAMGRLATTQGLTTAASQAQEMAELIDRGIALAPTYRDGPSNTSLGNLYYAGAVFYRVVPDWFWIEWVIGVRGDKERSVEMSRQAVSISGSRIDYRVELGAGLVCLGTSEDDPARIEEGREVLRRAATLGGGMETDRIDLEHAEKILEDPDLACGYSRDGWVGIDEATAREASR